MVYESAGGVVEVQPSALVLGDGQTVPFDECLWTTQVRLQAMLKHEQRSPTNSSAGCGSP